MMINELIDKLDFKNNVDLFIRNVNENEIKYKIIFLSSLIDELFLIELINSLKGVIDIGDIYSQLVK